MRATWRTLVRPVFLAILPLLAAAPLLATPTARSSTSMAYDEHLQRIVLFGGLTDADSSRVRYELGDTWEWSGQRWVQIYTSGSPDARSAPALAYDSIRQQVILFGGQSGSTFFNDTWAYRNRDWVRIVTPNSPSGRRFPVMAFDPLRDRMVMYGGADSTGNLRDTWEFDGTSWAVKNEGGPQLTGSMMVYDEARNKMILLGMNGENSEMYNWTGTSWERNSATTPTCVGLGGLVYQHHNEKVLFAGGQCGNSGVENTNWEWDGTTWTKLTTSGTQGVLVAFGFAYDQIRKETVLFGGDAFGASDGTYIYSDLRWRVLNDAFAPGARSLSVFEYDPVHNVSWLFGGRTAGTEYADLWKLSGVNWTQVVVENIPTTCIESSGTWDAERNRLVVVCSDSNVFEWDGEKWQAFTGITDKPSARKWSSVVYDPKSKTSFLFGGYTLSNLYFREIWSWNGAKWTRLAKDKTQPPGRALAATFYEPTSQRIVVFGGIGRNSQTANITRYGDMWAWNGQSWTELKPPVLPPARYGARAVWNPETGKAMLFGGKSAVEKYLNDQWEWDGTTWREVTSSSEPGVRMNYGLLFDTSLRKYVLFGGYAGLYYSELWQTDGTSWSLQQQPFGGRRRAASIVRPSSSQILPENDQ